MTGDAPANTTLKLENHNRTLEVQELPLERNTALWIQVSSEYILFHQEIYLDRDEVKRLADTLNKWLKESEDGE